MIGSTADNEYGDCRDDLEPPDGDDVLDLHPELACFVDACRNDLCYFRDFFSDCIFSSCFFTAGHNCLSPVSGLF